MKTTNYYNAFIEVADDCPAHSAQAPPHTSDRKTVAYLQYEMIRHNPYKYTSDDVLFHVFVQRNNISAARLAEERERFFLKGQPCFRSSPLAKRYGWGVHSDSDGKIAIYPVESEEYHELASSPSIQHLKAMRTRRPID